jgi:threonyl-tRNA synthetase
MITVKIKMLNEGINVKNKEKVKLKDLVSDFPNVIGFVFNDEVVDLERMIEEDAELEAVVLDQDTPEARKIYRHSMAHILAHAVKRIFPHAKLGIGPAIEEGFYYDFDVELHTQDLERISSEMRKIIKEDYPFKRIEMGVEEARRLLEEQNEPYKLELLEEIAQGQNEDFKVSFYKHGDFIDLCLGPHLPSTGLVKHFKLLDIAGAYWRGNETREMLQRIYGTAFLRKKDLDDFLKRREEASKRDHRLLGTELDLFSIHPQAGPGLVLWHPKGALIRHLIEDFWRKEHYKRGYQLVYSPHIARLDLWKISGHWDFYRDSMYSPINVEGQDYLLKPMNCPFAVLMFKSKTRSWRDLPLRWAELGTVYRYERSGVLHGMLRVRGFTQDDAHIFCRPDQLEDEIIGVIELAQFMLGAFGYKDYRLELSVRDVAGKEKYIGDDRVWEMAESALSEALKKKGLDYLRMEGEAKFYGPAIDIKVKDALGRAWQGPTIQVDFNFPERFDINYIGKDGLPHRVVMIHRTVLGAMERFVGGLVEHYGGAFPPWLSPVQVVVLPITDEHTDYATTVAKRLKEEGIRVEVDSTSKTLSYRIRRAQLQKIPYMLIVGEREKEKGEVALRLRTEEDLGPRPLEEFISFVKEKVEKKEGI